MTGYSDKLAIRQSALVILVPEANPLVATYRQRYDPSAAQGMPAHITLLYPFLPPAAISDDVLAELRVLFAAFPAFPYTLNAVRAFSDVLYLAPEPDAPFRALIAALAARFPQTPPYGGRIPVAEIVPHLIRLLIILIPLLPLTIAFSILRHRLFDIDLLINRALVYGMLTVSTMGLYVFIVGYLGSLFQARERSLIAFLATGLVALLFQPLRERLQRGVNRLMYGERDEPYAVLSRLGRRLETALTPTAGLQTVVETVARALKLPHVAIALKKKDGFETVASFGLPASDPLVLPLTHQEEIIGRLICTPRGPKEEFTEAERELLRNVARQAGPIAHALGLTADLQRSRERLVTAREEERRRLRRDLHDGLGPQLASLTLKLDAARNLLAHDPTAAEALLRDLKADAQAAIADIRRLVYGLRPPALDELGLVGALREHAASHSTQDGLRITVEAPEELPPLPAAVEVAAYRIALEALTNVARHAQARQCVVRLALDDGLQLEITDDGVGLAPGYQAGVGLTSMRERAAELGGTCVSEAGPEGGTRVWAELPVNSIA